MHIVVTGATGMLGGCVVETLLSAGHEVSATARRTSDTGRLQALGVRIMVLNGLPDQGFSQTLGRVDAIVHAAGFVTASAPFGSGGDAAEFERSNVSLTAALLEAALRQGVERFILVSSSSVYGRSVPVPTPEDAQLAPASAYGRSKLAAERAALEAAEAGLWMSIIRPTVIYGPRDRHFTPLALRLARLPLLPLVDGGERLLDLVYVQDVADQIGRMLATPEANGRIYNCGSGRPSSIRALVDAYRALTGRGPRLLNITVEQAARTAWLSRRIASWIVPGVEGTLTPAGLDLMARDNLLDMQRAADELNFTPRFGLKDGLRRVLAEENA